MSEQRQVDNIFYEPYVLNGTFVKDILSTNNTNEVNFTYDKNMSHEFFLVHYVNTTAGNSLPNGGLLGLASDLGSGK